MRYFEKLKLILGIAGAFFCIFAGTEQASAQWGSRSRYEIGDNFVMATGKYEGRVGIYDGSGNYLRDSSVNRKLTSSFGIGGQYAMNFPLKRLGKNSTLSLSVAIIGNAYVWGDLNAYYNVSGELVNPDIALTGATVKYGLPIGLDIKKNTDALCHRNPHLGYAFGAGVIPQYNISALAGGGLATNFDFAAATSFAVTPYVKAEFSFYLGLCFKLKAMYSFLNVPLIDASKSNVYAGEGQPFKLTETGNLCLSFTTLPFSFRWKKLHWYNDFDPITLPFR